ncbi:MAG: hypothetical protein VX085_18660 [Pseudomonadota bacterium]|nr:hypothetical protein [Pseudomonadota bacterium]
MTESDYRAHMVARLTPTVLARCDTVPTLNKALDYWPRFFSWDWVTIMVTASRGQSHWRTPPRNVVNPGISPGVGHFPPDIERLRNPPWGMITVDEAWHHFEPQRPATIPRRDS